MILKKIAIAFCFYAVAVLATFLVMREAIKRRDARQNKRPPAPRFTATREPVMPADPCKDFNAWAAHIYHSVNAMNR